MRHALGVLGILAAGVLLAVSAAMNWRFGVSLGKTEFDGQIYGAASAAADCMKALVPFFFFAALKNRAWSQAVASFVVWVVVTAYSLTSAFGHAALNRFDVASDRSTEKLAYQDLRSDLTRAKEQLGWVPEHRPQATVAAEIEGLKAQKGWTVTEGCTKITGPYGRTFCQQVSGLQAELASATQAASLEVRIAGIQEKLSGVDASSAMSEADPQAAVLAKLTGFEIEQIQLAMTLFIALLLEVGSGFGMYIAFSQWKVYDQPAPAAPRMVPVNIAAAAVAGPSIAPVPVQIEKPRSGANDNATKVASASPAPQRLVAPESDVERYYKERIETQDGSSVTATELFEDYCQWCEELDKEPLAFPKFSRDFGELGVQKARVAGRVRYIGVARKSSRDLEEVKIPPVFGVKAA
ncbi:MAG: hypothetical protein NW217_07130 [Hyphomicrobiaceae bacterium]|nr:hypothetical protein [Hyphomicrobiaceae bacterium]